VLSAALLEVAGAGTVSVAQGSEFTSIEVDTETLTDEQIAAVEERANRAIRADLPIIGFSVDDTELAEYALRRPTKRSGKIRLVRIGDADAPFDLVACGGVHLTRTGLLNLVQTVGVERIRGHQRLHFKIGDRALTDYREKHRAITEAAELFSARPDASSGCRRSASPGYCCRRTWREPKPFSRLPLPERTARCSRRWLKRRARRSPQRARRSPRSS
jgi:alanyl-tRNA synthetase